MSRLTNFQLPLQAVRDYIKTQMATAWGLTENQVASRTQYPDEVGYLQLDMKDAAGSPDGLTEIYGVVFAGIMDKVERVNQNAFDYSTALQIYLLRKIDDTPHDDAVPILTKLGQLADLLMLPGTNRWSGVTGMKRRSVTRLASVFENVERFWNQKFAAGLLELRIDFEIEGDQ